MSTIAQLFSDSATPTGNLRTLELPGLVLPTGHLVACNPLAHCDPQPFTQICPAATQYICTGCRPETGLPTPSCA